MPVAALGTSGPGTDEGGDKAAWHHHNPRMAGNCGSALSVPGGSPRYVMCPAYRSIHRLR